MKTRDVGPTFHKVSVIGLGYIGLPTAALLASRKIKVIGVDMQNNICKKLAKILEWKLLFLDHRWCMDRE